MEYYAGKTLSRFRTTRDRNKRMLVTLNELVRDHRINQIALLRLNKQQRHSSELCSLYATVRRFCLKNGLTVVAQDPVQVRRKLTGGAKPSKANTMSRLIEIFPELKRYANGGSEWERRYYGHLFTAIGSGLVATCFAAPSEGVIK